MKRTFAVIAALVLLSALLLINVQANDLPSHTNEFYINDFAGVISEEYQKQILNHSAALDKATTAQISVVTVNSTNGKDPNTFAADLGNEWGVGSDDKDNGAIILLSLDPKEILISTGTGMGGALPASLCGRIIDDYGMAYLEKGDYSTGVYQIYLAVLTEVYKYYNLEVPTEVEDAILYKEPSIWETIIPFALIFVLIFILSLKRKKGSDDDDNHGGFGGGFPIGPIIIGRGFGPRSGGGFGGGFGGGGFGGGGGSFGGGGAGRRF